MAGRKPKLWTKEQQTQFEKLCEIFCTRKECAHVLGMDVRTLDKNIAETYPDTPTWEEAFERFSSTGRESLRRKQFELALSGDRTMLIWLGKNVLGQRDDPKKQEQEPTRGKLVQFEGKKLPKASSI